MLKKDTPRKINMEHTPLEKENHLPNHHFQVLHLKNMECIIPLIHHMYRSFLRVVHLRSLLIFGSRLKRRVPFGLGLITQTSGYQP